MGGNAELICSRLTEITCLQHRISLLSVLEALRDLWVPDPMQSLEWDTLTASLCSYVKGVWELNLDVQVSTLLAGIHWLSSKGEGGVWSTDRGGCKLTTESSADYQAGMWHRSHLHFNGRVCVALSVQLEDHLWKDFRGTEKNWNTHISNSLWPLSFLSAGRSTLLQTEVMGMPMSRVGQAEEGRKPFLQGSVAGVEVFLGFIHARVAQKYSNAQTVLSDNLTLSYMLCGVVDFCGF